MSERKRTERHVGDRGKSQYVTSGEAAAYLNVTTRTIRSMIADGRLRAYSLGSRMIRLRLDEVDAAMQPMGPT